MTLEHTFDLMRRVDFDPRGDGAGVAPETISSLSGAIQVDLYSLDSPLSEAIGALQKGTSPWVLFIDEAVTLESTEVERLMAALDDHPESAGFTLWTEGLGRLFGVFQDELSSVSADVLPPVAPPWLCLLNRRLLGQVGFGQWGYSTLELALLDAVIRLRGKERYFHILPSSNLLLDYEVWAETLFRHRSSALARDFTLFLGQHGAVAASLVPAQYRVEVLGRYVEPPSRPPLIETTEPLRFSVLCPVFKADFLEQMLASVCSQTWPHWQLLIIVDGPPPTVEKRILDMLASYAADPRVVHSRQENRGTGPTRQRLADLAQGDFLVTIDDDDELAPEALSTFAAVAAAHPEAAVLRGGARLIGFFDEQLPPKPRYVVDGIFNDPFEVTQPYAIRREAFRALGGYDWDGAFANAGEDTLLFHKIDRARLPTLLIDRPLYHRRLSFKNQSLYFDADQLSAHFHNVVGRLSPSGRKVVERNLDDDGHFLKLRTIYESADGRRVVCSTRFFQYRTFGDLNEVTIDLEVTSRCNAVCSFCPRDTMPDTKSMIALEVVEALARQIQRLELSCKVVLCGIGESTMHPQLDQIAHLLSAAGARLALTTNGQLLDTELFRVLVENGVQEFNISLNAATAETHRAVMKMKRFDQIVARIDEVIELQQQHFPKIRIHVSSVVCNLNLHEIPDFVARWRQRPVAGLWLHPVNNRAGLLAEAVETADMERLADRYAADPRVVVDIFADQQPEGGLCKIARGLNFISADGELRLCAMDYRRQTSYGNLLSSSIDTMYFRKLRAYLDGETLNLCESCDFYPDQPTPPADDRPSAKGYEHALESSLLQSQQVDPEQRVELRLGAYPCLLPHVRLEGEGLHQGNIQVLALDETSRLFAERCDGDTRFEELLESAPDAQSLAAIMPHLVWLDQPLGTDLSDPSLRQSDKEISFLVLCPNGSEAYLSMGGYLLNQRGHSKGTYAVCFTQTEPAAYCLEQASAHETEALRIDETNFCARVLGLSRRILAFPEYSVRRGKRSEQYIRAREQTFFNTLRLHVHQLITEIEPDLVFAPAALAGHADQSMLFNVVQSLHEEALFACTYLLYEDFPACCTYLNLDDFHNRLDRDAIEVVPQLEDISASMAGRDLLVQVARSRHTLLEKRRLRQMAEDVARQEDRGRSMPDAPQGLERFWQLTKSVQTT